MSHNRISHIASLGPDTEGLPLNPEVYTRKTESEQKGYAAAYKEALKRPLFSKDTIISYFDPSDSAGDSALDPNIIGFETKTKEVRQLKARIATYLKAVPGEFFKALRKIEDIRLPISEDIGDLTIKLHVVNLNTAEQLATKAVNHSQVQLAYVRLSSGSIIVRPAERDIKNPIAEENIEDMKLLPGMKYCIQRKGTEEASIFCYLSVIPEDEEGNKLPANDSAKDIRLEISFKTSTEELDGYFNQKYTYTVPNTERSIERVFRY